MRLTERLVSLASSLTLLLIGGTGILTGIGFFGAQEQPILRAVKSWFLESSPQYDSPLLLVGYFLVLLLGILMAWLALRDGSSEDVVLMETSEGQVEVALEALSDVIVSLTDEVEGIRRVQPEIANDADSVTIRVNLEITGDVDVPNVVRRYKQNLRSELSEVFKIKNLESISVRIQNMPDYRAGSDRGETGSSSPPDESIRHED